MTEQEYLELYNSREDNFIYFRPELVPYRVPEDYPTMHSYVWDTRLHEGFLHHKTDETFKFPMAPLTACESWDVWHPKCPNCGKMCMAVYTHYDDHVYQAYCPSCQAHGPHIGDWESKTAEKDAYEGFFHPTKGKVASLTYYPSEDHDFRYLIRLLKESDQYTALFDEKYPDPYKKKRFYATLDKAKQACIRDFQRRAHKKAISWGYIKITDDDIVVKKSDLCGDCRRSLLGLGSPPDAAEFYKDEEGED